MNDYRFSDLHIGLTHSFEETVTDEKMQLFLELSGDSNPMHLDEQYAKAAGFRSRLVYGLLTSAFYSTLAGIYLPGKSCLLHGIDIKFQNPVYIGERLVISGTVKELDERFKTLVIQAYITNENGQKVSKAVIRAGVLDG